MRIRDLCNELAKEYSTDIQTSIRENQIIIRVQIALSSIKQFEQGVLYATDSIEDILLMDTPPENLLFLGDNHVLSNCQLNCNFICLSGDKSLTTVTNLMTGILERDAYFVKCKSELFECILLDNYLESLIDKTFALLKNPIILMDHTHSVITYRANEPVDNNIWRTIVSLKHHDFENTNDVFYRALNELIQTKHPVYAPMDKDTCVMCSIICADYFWGFLVLTDSYEEVTEDDLKLLRVVADIIAVKNEKYEMLGTSNELYYSQIIKDLLVANICSEKALKTRLISRKWVMKKYKCVLLTSVFDEEPNYIKYIIRRIVSISKDIKAIHFEGNLVILVEYDDKLKCNLLDSIKEVATQLKLIIGISDEFEDMLTIAQYYEQAQKILHLRELMDAQSLINYYSNYKFVDFLKICCEKLEYTEYIHHTVSDIQQYDDEHNTQYGETLYYYLLNGKSLTKTCQQMHLHKNTVNYRINQIRELFHPYLDNAEEALHIFLSFSLINMSAKLSESNNDFD